MNSANKGRCGRNRLASVTGLATLVALPAVADPVIEVTHKSDGRYTLILEVDEAIGVAEGQRLLLPTAVQLCDGLAPRLGAYEFTTREALDGQVSADSFVLAQEIECGDFERAEDKPPSRELGDPERAEIERVTAARAAEFHEALADGEDQEALAMFSGLSPSAIPDEDWHNEQAEFKAKAGPLGEVDVWKVTLYVDPPDAPEPGIYVATDLEVSYENLIVCGYFIWLEDPDGTLRITRREVGEIPADVASTMSESQLAKVRSDFRCRPDSEPD